MPVVVPRSGGIAFLSAHYPPDPSGIGDYTHFLANSLADLGYPVEIVSSLGGTDPESYGLTPGVGLHRVVRGWGISRLPQILRVIRSLPRSTLIIQYAPHAFSRTGITLSPSLLPFLVRVTTRHRVVVNIHEISIPFSRAWRHVVGALWQRAMAQLLGITAHGVTATTGEWADLLRRIGVCRSVAVIPVGSNIPLVPIDAVERCRIRQALGVNGELLVGSFGSRGPGREEGLLVQALDRIRQYRPVKLVWFGNVGRARSRGEDKGVIWTGPLPHRDISRLMSACDVFAMPFRKGVSTRRTTVAAALLHGLPVLTTRGVATDGRFVDGENMLLAPAGDAAAFVAGLERLAMDPQLRDRLGRQGRALYASQFSWEVIARQVAEHALLRVQ